MHGALHGSSRADCGALWLALAAPALGSERARIEPVLDDLGDARVTARDDAGATRSDERLVFYEPRTPRNAEESADFERRLAELRRKLEQRRIETELIAEIQAARAQRRELELRADSKPAQ